MTFVKMIYLKKIKYIVLKINLSVFSAKAYTEYYNHLLVRSRFLNISEPGCIVMDLAR